MPRPEYAAHRFRRFDRFVCYLRSAKSVKSVGNADWVHDIDHSPRRAALGSARVARRAGRRLATSATLSNNTATRP